jgi:valacyclovir hydrolase
MPDFVCDGRRLFYREKGAGPLLLILPGNTASSALHESELNHFGAGRHAVALDFWGTGQSDRIIAWPDNWWEQGAHDATALAEYLGYRRFLVMGTSGGAIVALLMAILYLERVLGVIADSAVERLAAPTLSREVEKRAERSPGQVAFWQKAHGDDWAQVVEADSDFLLRFEKAGGDCFHGRLKEIRCPVLLSASLEDESLPQVEAQLRAMAQQIGASRVYLAQTGGHPLMWNRPDEFQHQADDFLDSGADAPRREPRG